MKRVKTDYVIADKTDGHWPGRLPYRGPDTPKGRGYRTREDAVARRRRIIEHYNATSGCSPGDLRIVERHGVLLREVC